MYWWLGLGSGILVDTSETTRIPADQGLNLALTISCVPASPLSSYDFSINRNRSCLRQVEGCVDCLTPIKKSVSHDIKWSRGNDQYKSAECPEMFPPPQLCLTLCVMSHTDVYSEERCDRQARALCHRHRVLSGFILHTNGHLQSDMWPLDLHSVSRVPTKASRGEKKQILEQPSRPNITTHPS